ncbi:MAG TPA: protein-L-isoaspartate(D-aspartate) O-methyltransferase [Candidatus Acidoferrales bacterium]|nr:protein-L-isoaspartate(D-aspartate) O-methyltransferase [Candidatus Acidoferrales bacterium]
MNTTTSSLRKSLSRSLLVVVPFLLLSWLPIGSFFGAPGEEDFARWRLEMVEKDLRGRGIKDERVLKAMSTIPRHLFVPANQRHLAYVDGARPIEAGQTISQPYIVALMTELLELKPTDKVLEIGTGSGYQAAVLSHLAREVYTIEIIPELAAKARELLAQLNHDNVSVRVGDGFYGWEEKAPFDAILITAAAEHIPQPLWDQLAEGGRLVMPLGRPHRDQKLVRARKLQGKRHLETITGVVFVPMTGAAQEPR